MEFDWIEKILVTLNSNGFPPGMIVIIFVCVLLIRNPKIIEWVLRPHRESEKPAQDMEKKDIKDDNIRNHNVDRLECHTAMNSLKEYIHAENEDIKESFSNDLRGVHERIDNFILNAHVR